MRTLFRTLSSLILLAFLANPLAFSAGNTPGSGYSPLDSGTSERDWQAKVDAWVLEAASQGQAEYLLYLNEQADLSGAAGLTTRVEKGAFVFERLIATAERSQAALKAELERRGVEYRPFWIANMVWVRGGLTDLEALARRSDIAHVFANPSVHYDEPEAPAPAAAQEATTIEWNIRHVGADRVWAAGYTGQGVVVGGQDTGYDWQHPALINQYRGWDGAAADHNYSWHDAIHEDNPNSPNANTCGFDFKEPCDDGFHGTHTMGTILGDDGAGNQVGMAPGARWIGCRNMENGWGTPATYAECYQWFLAPTDLNDQNPRPDLAPQVINNSWACPVKEGCTDPSMLLTVVQNVRAAGILTVHSAGNDGSSCGTINTPAAIYDESFTVANTTMTDDISFNSSRGPVTVDGSNRPKPDISAPGSYIRSSIPPSYFGVLSGTSMAAPHVAGLAALLISAEPALAGQVDQIEAEIKAAAVPLANSQTCGGIPAGQVPNNVFGYGRIDAVKTVLPHMPAELSVSKTASAEAVHPGETLTYTLAVTNTHPLLSIHNLVVSDTLPAEVSWITATLPHQFDGSAVRWTLSELSAGSRAEFQLVVGAPVTITDTIENSIYSADSDETQPAAGPPVYTDIIPLPGVTVSAGDQETIRPGESITYMVFISNTLENEHDFTIGLESSRGWASLPTQEITTIPNTVTIIPLEVTVPVDAPYGALEESEITVRSTTVPGMFAKTVYRTRTPVQFFLPFLVFSP